MSLYHEAASFLSPNAKSETGLLGSVKSRVFTAKALKNSPAQIYALVVETTKWSGVLSPIIDKAALLTIEKKLTPCLALLLVHDLLLAKRGIALSKDHGLRSSVEKHRARLSAEFIRARIQAGAASIDQWKRQIAPSNATLDPKHPRWVRLNGLRKTAKPSDFEQSLLSKQEVYSIEKVALAESTDDIFSRDSHVSNLIALPAGAELTNTSAYKEGRIILQDKASCFPPWLLCPLGGCGDIIDACAAPGNKTTLLADIVRQQTADPTNIEQKLFAVERDALRAQTLQKMVKIAGADRFVECLVKQDFLKLQPDDARFKKVGAILLDPSCSGSGIVGRDEESIMLLPPLVLPGKANGKADTASSKNKKPRNRKTESPRKHIPSEEATIAFPLDPAKDEQESAVPEGPGLAGRLENLSNFQTMMLLHALKFPSVRKIAYSTCSVHAQENEQVVVNVLTSAQGRAGGWRILRRDEQIPGMRDWLHRGNSEAVKDAVARVGQVHTLKADLEDIVGGCIRCSKGTEDGTMGFFAAVFTRDLRNDGPYNQSTAQTDKRPQEHSEPEWEGFSDAG